jgi:hypothetical protein
MRSLVTVAQRFFGTHVFDALYAVSVAKAATRRRAPEDVFCCEPICNVRTDFGLAPKLFKEWIGRRVPSKVAVATPVRWNVTE